MKPSIRVEHLSKRYRIGQKSGLAAWLPGLKKRTPSEHHWAVQDICFELEPGESMGIIGPNGAGKTTILKLLSGVTQPTSGTVSLNGRFSALIELGAGFHPDLTGRENIYLNGTILGMRRADINARFDEIVEFAGIGSYLDTPVKRYSSGMHARLGFSIAAHIDPEILLVDEVLAVGDHAFQMKCYARMDELRARGTSLIFISHNMQAVRRVCDKGLVMYAGEAIFKGSADDAVVAYSDAVRKAAARVSAKPVPMSNGLSQRVMTFDLEIEKVTLLDAQARQPKNVIESGQEAILAIEVVSHKPVPNPIFGFSVRTMDGRALYNATTKWLNVDIPCLEPNQRYCIEFRFQLPLLDGQYELGVDAASADLSHYYDRLERALTFTIRDGVGARGVVDLNAKVSFAQSIYAGVRE
jgi:ABC-2 type transport system ATP-binding protein/lipopolysaccharide transport system ATP-binding protein